jgi:hypothetical protein
MDCPHLYLIPAPTNGDNNHTLHRTMKLLLNAVIQIQSPNPRPSRNRLPLRIPMALTLHHNTPPPSRQVENYLSLRWVIHTIVQTAYQLPHHRIQYQSLIPLDLIDL